MIEFKNYDPQSRVQLQGFEVIDYPIAQMVENTFPEFKSNNPIDLISENLKSPDVFKTKLGDVKQLQNLHTSKYSYKLYRINHILAGLLFKDREFDVLNNQFFCKPSNYKMTSAHQDNAYFESDEDVYTFWVPMQDVDILNSCMFYVPGSHLRGLVKHDAIGTNVRVRTGAKGVSLYSSYYENCDFVKVPMKRCEVLVHDKNTMHFSSPNLSDDIRIAFTAIIKFN